MAPRRMERLGRHIILKMVKLALRIRAPALLKRLEVVLLVGKNGFDKVVKELGWKIVKVMIKP